MDRSAHRQASAWRQEEEEEEEEEGGREGGREGREVWRVWARRERQGTGPTRAQTSLMASPCGGGREKGREGGREGK